MSVAAAVPAPVTPSSRATRPRVVHLIPTFFARSGGGIIGGAERYAFELARHMAERVPTTLVTFGEADADEQMGALRVRVVGGAWYVRGVRGNPLSVRALRMLLQADVIHCHQQHVLTSSAAALLARTTGRRVFVSDLGGGAWDVSSYVSTDGWYHGHLHISEYSRRVFGQVDRANAHVILGGVDTERFSPDPTSRREGPAIFVGRLLPHKGVDDLVRAAAPDVPVDLVGECYDPAFASHLQELAVGRPVRFLHGVSDTALIEQYRAASCVVLPSVYRGWGGRETNVPELLGQTLLEGMACGIPAICTNVASLPEVVRDGVTGFVVPPNDPEALRARLRWLREHPLDAARMGRAARAHVLEHFTWDAVVQRCLNLYDAAG